MPPPAPPMPPPARLPVLDLASTSRRRSVRDPLSNEAVQAAEEEEEHYGTVAWLLDELTVWLGRDIGWEVADATLHHSQPHGVQAHNPNQSVLPPVSAGASLWSLHTVRPTYCMHAHSSLPHPPGFTYTCMRIWIPTPPYPIHLGSPTHAMRIWMPTPPYPIHLDSPHSNIRCAYTYSSNSPPHMHAYSYTCICIPIPTPPSRPKTILPHNVLPPSEPRRPAHVPPLAPGSLTGCGHHKPSAARRPVVREPAHIVGVWLPGGPLYTPAARHVPPAVPAGRRATTSPSH